MLTDANGHNNRLDEDTLRERLRFPLMFVPRPTELRVRLARQHGRADAAQEAAQRAGTGPGTLAAGSVHYGEWTATQLLILEG